MCHSKTCWALYKIVHLFINFHELCETSALTRMHAAQQAESSTPDMF